MNLVSFLHLETKKKTCSNFSSSCSSQMNYKERFPSSSQRHQRKHTHTHISPAVPLSLWLFGPHENKYIQPDLPSFISATAASVCVCVRAWFMPCLATAPCALSFSHPINPLIVFQQFANWLMMRNNWCCGATSVSSCWAVSQPPN